ncbi:MAG: sulfurtransferase TusA family protein [Dehalococcoidia bacterium]|nr:sulfurtransferase TusA family protein [Dehalococcoidia bacterium]
MESAVPDRVLDCLGDFCPMPILRTKKAIDEMDVGQILELWVDDRAAEEDVRRWAKRTGHLIVDMAWGAKFLTFHIQKVH